MKAILILIGLLAGSVSFAQIEDSKLDIRHQELIEKALIEKCSISRGFIKEVSTQKEEIRVDQGITDVKYNSRFEVHIRLDQMIFDVYDVIVKSSYYSMYDHASKNWGVFEIDEISECIMR